jgi:predicted nucleic acid-binding protein
MIYLDTSAAAKLVRAESESAALSVFLAERAGAPLTSSVLLYPELIRAVCRVRLELAPRAQRFLERVFRMPISAEVVMEAAVIGDASLRTLDAIHLATAMEIASELTAFVTYDKRLASAAKALGLPVEAPA